MPDGPFSFDKTGHNNFRLGCYCGCTGVGAGRSRPYFVGSI